MSLSAALRAAASSAKALTVVWPLVPILPYCVYRLFPSVHTSQNLLDDPSTNSKCRRAGDVALATGAGAAVTGAGAGRAVGAGAAGVFVAGAAGGAFVAA